MTKILGQIERQEPRFSSLINNQELGHHLVDPKKLGLGATAFAFLTACSPLLPTNPNQQQPTESQPTSPQQSPTQETPKTSPTLTPGTTQEELTTLQSGETLAMGGINWEFKSYSGQQLVSELGQNFAGWKIITDSKNQVYNLSYTDQEGRYNLILPHAPAGYQIDTTNYLAYASDNKTAFFLDVALPGSWIEEKGIAGPVAIPSKAVLAQSPDGNYQVIVIYGKDVVEQNSRLKDNPLILTNTGDWAFVGKVKTLTLTEGQKIEKVEDGSLRLINPDGSYLTILTSWNQVKKPDQVNDLFKAKGVAITEINGQSIEISYPSSDFAQKNNISEYGTLEDGTVVGYQIITDQATGETKKIVVAKAVANVTDNNQVNISWQETVPLENLAVPKPDFEHSTELQTAISDFVNAMKMAGIELTPEQIQQNLAFKTITGTDGKEYVVGYTENTGDEFSNKVPLLIWSQDQKTEEWEWKKIKGYKQLTALTGNRIASETSQYYMRTDADYRTMFLNNYDMAVTSGVFEMNQLYKNVPQKKLTPEEIITYYNWSKFDNYLNIAGTYGIPLKITNLFGGIYNLSTAPWLTNMSNDQIETWMDLHVKAVADRINQYNSKQKEGNKVTIEEIDVYNEVFGADPNFNSEVVSRRLGLEKALEIAFRSARKYFPKSILMLADNIHYGTDTNIAINEESTRIDEIVGSLKARGVPIDGISEHGHLFIKDFKSQEDVNNYITQLTVRAKALNQVGLVFEIGEADIDILGASSEQLKRAMLLMTAEMKVSLDYSGRYILWGCGGVPKFSWMFDPAYPYGKASPLTPFDNNYKPMAYNYYLLKALLSNVK